MKISQKSKRKRRSRIAKKGNIPGTLTLVTEASGSRVNMHLFDFDHNEYMENVPLEDLDSVYHLTEKPSTTWLNIDGIHDTELMSKLGDLFQIDSLVLEDAVNIDHRPKLEEYENFAFIVLKMLYVNQETKCIESEQVSLVIFKSLLISFQEKEGDVFDPIRERIRKALGRVRNQGVDYLAYLLMDIIIDNYFVIIEFLGEQMEELEERVINKPSEELLNELQGFKKELMLVRKAIYPLREMLRTMSIGQSSFIRKETTKYYRDAYDHSISVIDSIESYIEITNSIRDLYMSNMSNRMNQIMKVLTIMSSIFIPLTFVAGVYGMNFKYMPELYSHYGYPIVWGVMLLVTLGMILFFKRRDWM